MDIESRTLYECREHQIIMMKCNSPVRLCLSNLVKNVCVGVNVYEQGIDYVMNIGEIM